MYTLRKNRKGEGGSVHPLFLHCPPISLSSISRIIGLFFIRKLKETKQMCPLQKQSSVYIYYNLPEYLQIIQKEQQ